MNHTQPKKVNSGNKKLAIIAALITVVLLATGFVWAHKKVNVIADGKALVINTLHSKPEAILAQAGINLGPKDEYHLSAINVANDTTIEVYRSVPVTVTCQGNSELVFTAKPTVGEMAQSMGYAKEKVKLFPSEQTRIQPGMEVRIVVLTEKVVEREVADPFPIVRHPEPMLEKGLEEVLEEGRDGLKLATVKIHYADGEQVSEEIVAEKVMIAPKSEVVRTGTRETVDTSRGTMRFKRVEMMHASAYLPSDGPGHGITASGIPARHGVVAVDPNCIPLGTRLYIPGYGVALAADTGGMIIGNTIDLCMEDASDAWNFGRRWIKVYVLSD